MQLYSFMSVSERKEAGEMFQIRFETITIKYIINNQIWNAGKAYSYSIGKVCKS